MTLDECDAFCRALPHSTFVEQWGGAHVWKIGGKVFAILHEGEDGEAQASFKTGEIAFEALSDAPGCRPAPYLASRGMKWIQRTGPETLDDEGLREHLLESRRLVAAGLPKKTRAALGFEV